jgi:hypothetical protein
MNIHDSDDSHTRDPEKRSPAAEAPSFGLLKPR